jgi:hypothetical protein
VDPVLIPVGVASLEVKRWATFYIQEALACTWGSSAMSSGTVRAKGTLGLSAVDANMNRSVNPNKGTSAAQDSGLQFALYDQTGFLLEKLGPRLSVWPQDEDEFTDVEQSWMANIRFFPGSLSATVRNVVIRQY